MVSATKCVLCIDDDEELLSSLQLSLQELGFKVLAAALGKRGLEIIAGQPVHIVVLDYLMPEMDGEALTREIRRMRPLIPIIMYSGALEQVPDRVLDLVDEFVSKREPISNLLYYVRKLALGPQRTKRAFPRYPVHLPFLIIDDDAPEGGVFHGQSRDLSEGGMGGTVDRKLPRHHANRRG